MKFFRLLSLSVLSVLLFSCRQPLTDGEHTLVILTTNDVHGQWFDSSYVDSRVRKSLFAVNYYVDSIRKAQGPENVLLLDAGDCLQGDNAAYYFNYVDTLSPHLYPRLASYMQYDAVAVGNHDIETGHKVYDRVRGQLQERGIPFLAANAIRNDNGKPYFQPYTIVERAGLKVAVLGYTNANIKAWLAEEVWSGMHFVSIAEVIQKDVDAIRRKEHPDVVIALMHTSTGEGNGAILEGEGLDIFDQIEGLDWYICSHDHKPFVEARKNTALLNSGSHCRYLAQGKLHLTVQSGKVVSKRYETSLIPVNAQKADPEMRAHFQEEFQTVKDFTRMEVGTLNVDLRTRDAYVGMSSYVNLIHTLCLSQEPAQLSIAAPLTYNGNVRTGTLVFNDLFTIYPFENQLYVITMTGDEVRRFLEASYQRWILTWEKQGDHILHIIPRDNMRMSQSGWSFANLPYNFDSMAGLNYTVDVTKPVGERVVITTLADGTPFSEDATYNVAVTSYRASGGGNLLDEIGINTDQIDQRVVARYPEIRNLLYKRLQEDASIDPEEISDPAVLGEWKFIPENIAAPVLEADMKLLFGRE